MPYVEEWIEPELFLSHQDVRVYRTYKDGDMDYMRCYWYTTDIYEREEYEFDVRKLPVPPGVSKDDHAAIIRHAIDHDLLKLPTD